MYYPLEICQNFLCPHCVQVSARRIDKMNTVYNFFESAAGHLSRGVEAVGFFSIAFTAAGLMLAAALACFTALFFRRQRGGKNLCRPISASALFAFVITGVAAAAGEVSAAVLSAVVLLLLVQYAVLYCAFYIAAMFKFRRGVRVVKNFGRKNSAVSQSQFQRCVEGRLPQQAQPQGGGLRKIDALIDGLIEKKASEYTLREVLKTLELAHRAEYLSPENNAHLQESIDKIKRCNQLSGGAQRTDLQASYADKNVSSR